jgi:formylglycine-generating enzyme required for sulfatase activity
MTCDQQHAPLMACPHEEHDRAAMGLPPQLVDRLPVEPRQYVAGLVHTSPEILADVLGDASQSQPRRFFAGQLLALLGDPRITPDAPAMVDIPAATIYVGLDRQAVDSLQQCLRHQVHMSAFRLMRYPVTNYEYQRFLADTDYWSLPTSWRFGRYPHELANHPVWSISESAARMYASWLSYRLGRRFRLPTETEWEYAACGGDDREYPWGNTFHPNAANTAEAGPLSTTPVGMYPAGRNPFGVDDLSGNVAEYVADDCTPYPGGIGIDDDPTVTRQTCVITLGGGFTTFGNLARCRHRHRHRHQPQHPVGFRLAETPN